MNNKDIYTGSHLQCVDNVVKYKVCTYCGGKLSKKDIRDMLNPQPVCFECSHINWGCSPKLYDEAKKYVEENQFRYVTEGHEEYVKQVNINKVVEMFEWYIQKENKLCG